MAIAARGAPFSGRALILVTDSAAFARRGQSVPFATAAVSPTRRVRAAKESARTIAGGRANPAASPPLPRRQWEYRRMNTVVYRFYDGGPHAVRRSLRDPLQSSALFGGVFRCARSDYHCSTPQIVRRRQIPFPRVGRSHDPLVAGSRPARPTSEVCYPHRAGWIDNGIPQCVSTSVRRVIDARHASSAGMASVMVPTSRHGSVDRLLQA
jgi:hypothetical protein